MDAGAVVRAESSSWSRSIKIVILNLFQDNRRPPCIILKQVQDDDKIDDDKIAAALPDKRATAA